MQKTSRRTIGTVVFLTGLAIGLALALAPIWGDYEGMSYFSSGGAYAAFDGLRCPILAARSDVTTITATLENPGNKQVEPYYEVVISGVSATRSIDGHIVVPPHSSRTAQWTVNANDIDLGFFIMIKMDILPLPGSPAREGTCGIVVLNLGPLNGSQILGLGLALALGGMVVGLAVREGTGQSTSSRDLSVRNGLRTAGVTTCLAMLTGFLGWWLIGFILGAITVLLVVVLLRVAEG